MARRLAFPLLCALAHLGAVIAYLPLLTLLLPLQVEAIAGAQRIGLLAAVMAAGAVAAGGTNLLFGWASDRTGHRRAWLAAGLAGTGLAFVALARAGDAWALGIAIAAFQTALNAMLAPLLALIAEEVPDEDKGLMGGLLGGAYPIALLLGPVLVSRVAPDARLLVVAVVTAGCVAPLLATRAPRNAVPVRADGGVGDHFDLALTLAARLLVQVAGNVLFVFLLFFMEGFLSTEQKGEAAPRVGGLLVLASLMALPVALLLGRWSDRIGRRKPFLLLTATLAAGGLAGMGVAEDWRAAAAGYTLFAVGWNSFLALQVGLAMEVLPDPARRGRDLGLLNLANTLPVLIGQALTWALATPRHVGPLLFTLATLTLAGGLATLGIRARR